MIRYADDFVILCRSEDGSPKRLCDLVRQADRRTRTYPAPGQDPPGGRQPFPEQGFDFLGYHFERGTRWPRKKSLKKLKDAIRSKTRRSNGHSLAAIIEDVNRTLRGLV